MTTTERVHTGTLLIVDDVPNNLRVLFDCLKRYQFKLRIARDGEDALRQVALAPPDLILLDIMMPTLDGFETCRRLKADPNTAQIPVIFMTALTDTVDKIKGFELGAVDYITKPFQPEEVLMRINTHLTLQKLQSTLTEKNQLLQQQNQELEAFAHTVAHDLKNPLSTIVNFIGILSEEYANQFDAQTLHLLKTIEQESWRSFEIIDALLLLASARRRHIHFSLLNMSSILRRVKQRLTPMIEQYNAQVDFPSEWPLAKGFAPWVEEIWVNYLSNAIKYGGRPPIIETGANPLPDSDFVRFWVKDNGDGLSPSAQKKLFTPFTRIGQSRVEGHGLGLSIVQRIVERFGGEVGLESHPGQGSLFFFTLPTREPEVITYDDER
jgi:signal transduction histidine kinase